MSEEIEQLHADVDGLRETLGTLIAWLRAELGEESMRALLAKLPEPR